MSEPTAKEARRGLVCCWCNERITKVGKLDTHGLCKGCGDWDAAAEPVALPPDQEHDKRD